MAALVIQKLWRGYVERKRFSKLRKSAFIVQRVWKRFVNRQREKRYKKLEEQRQTIQNRQNANLERLKE